VLNLQEHIKETSGQTPNRYLPIIGTLFIFIATANLLVIVPLFEPPTGSLSTTAALAILQFLVKALILYSFQTSFSETNHTTYPVAIPNSQINF